MDTGKETNVKDMRPNNTTDAAERVVRNVEYPHRRLRREQEEAPEGVCPYFIRDRGRGVIYCECARFHFPDKLSRREIVYTYCAHPSGYKQCVLKQAMDGFYQRKFDKLDAARQEGDAS